MGKKHREKRQKYVELLRQVEKDREAYLEKRRKRQRNADNEDGTTESGFFRQSAATTTDSSESCLKKRRVEGPAASEQEDTISQQTPSVNAGAEEVKPSPEKTAKKLKTKRY